MWPHGEDRLFRNFYFPLFITNTLQLQQPIEAKKKEKSHLYPNFLMHLSNRPAGSVGRASPDARYVDSRYGQS